MSDGIDRRRFLKVLGVTGGGAAALSACGIGPEPTRKLIPYLVAPEGQIPGIATVYALPAIPDTNDLHTATVTSDPDGNAIVSVTIATLDDSVRELRFVLRFDPVGDGAYRLLDAVWQQRCRVGRGHQGWSRELCV